MRRRVGDWGFPLITDTSHFFSLRQAEARGMSFSAESHFEIVSQFATDLFAKVPRLEIAEVHQIQLGNSGSWKVLSRYG